jgi:hypothetical protein
MSRGKIHRSQRVYENNQIAREIIDFHAEPSPAGPFKQKSEILSINKLRCIKWIAFFLKLPEKFWARNTQARFDNVRLQISVGRFDVSGRLQKVFLISQSKLDA